MRFDRLKTLERRFKEQAVDGLLNVKELIMQRARSARATDTTAVRACVADLLMLEETVDVDQGDFTGWLGQGESTAGSRRANDQIRLRQGGENLREKGPLQSARVGDLGDRELCLPTVITFG